VTFDFFHQVLPTVSKRDEVIVQLPLGTNTSPLLGQHNWASFVDGNGPPQKATLVFEYNWTNNGDPANREYSSIGNVLGCSYIVACR